MNKIRSNLYLDKELKKQAKELFKSYGLSLSDGINLVLKELLKSKNKEIILPFKIEPINTKDPDYKILKKAEDNYENNKENYVDIDEIDWD